MAFQITGPGTYKTRGGRVAEIEYVSKAPGEFIYCGFIHGDEGGDTWKACGQYGANNPSEHDIVGVWEESLAPQVAELGIDTHTSEYTYDLTKISERFRALEDGRSLQNQFNNVVRPDELDSSYVYILIDKDYTWSLVPLKRKVVTKEYIYQHIDSGRILQPVRFDYPLTSNDYKCLGAIEGSEQTEEVEV